MWPGGVSVVCPGAVSADTCHGRDSASHSCEHVPLS